MLNSTRSLVGTLTSLTANLADLRVEAWDADGICPDLIDVALTDSRGHFTMQLDARNQILEQLGSDLNIQQMTGLKTNKQHQRSYSHSRLEY